MRIGSVWLTTEEEWLQSTDAWAMVAHLRSTEVVSDRKWRLFVAAFWRWQADNLTGQARRDLLERVEITEHWAEHGKLTRGKRRSRSRNVIFFAEAFFAAANTAVSPSSWRTEVGRRAIELQPRLIRDVIENPFRSVVFNPAWQTPSVLGLACTVYENRAFDSLPILADALSDAGCDQEEVLAHCRSEGPHVRGCWVLDRLLGKE